MIIFVGDKPSKKNINPEIPFVGTKSYKRLLEWIGKLDIDISETLIVNRSGVEPYSFSTPEDLHILFRGYSSQTDYCPGDKIIALGREAAKLLESNHIPYFEMPHPSGLNRKLNDKKWLKAELNRCKEWLNV